MGLVVGQKRRFKRDISPNPHQFQKGRESLKKFRKYADKKFICVRTFQSGNDQPEIRKIEVI